MQIKANAVGRRSRFGPLARNMREYPILYIMGFIVAIYYLLFCYLPMYGIVMSFQDFRPALGFMQSRWVGLKHFRRFVNSIYFWRLIGNTLSINGGMLVFAFPLSIVFALLLNELRCTGFRRVVQTVAYMPHFVSSVVICGLMVKFCSTSGVLTIVLSTLGLQQTNLLTVPAYFQPLYIGMNIWQNLGWDSIIYFAALTAVDPQLHEAAQIDGAGRWRRMWHVTLPAIMPTIVILLIMRIGSLMSLGWEKIFLLYNDRVLETADVISTYVYRCGLGNSEYSFGSAVGLMNSVVNVALLCGANMLSRKVNETSLW